MAATSRAFGLARVTNLSPKHHPKPRPPPLPTFSRHNNNNLLHTRRRPSTTSSATATVSCLSSGGGVSDDYFVSTRKSNLDRGFSVIAHMLKRIEPLDNSVISQAVSNSAKDSMKQTISTMLGLLPSDHFFVLIEVSKLPLHRLLFSSIITGYTLWNAEYRMSLTRNLDISVGGTSEELKELKLNLNSSNELKETNKEEEEEEEEEEEKEEYGESDEDELEMSPKVLGGLSAEALDYIRKLQLELENVKEEVNTHKQETRQIEYDRGNRNDLLDYLRSLDSNMVAELSRPSSIEVEDIIHQLVENTLRRFFKDDPPLNIMGDSVVASAENHQDGAAEFCDTIGTSRDYLAKLLFWCMLLGHHLRGLENRLHLSCVVGLL